VKRLRAHALALLGSGGLALSGPVTAQTRAAHSSNDTSLSKQFGTAAAERLLSSDSSRQRLRSFERLSLIATPRAVELLARALDPGGAARGAEEHLALVRALAPHATAVFARDALVRALSSPSVDADAGPLSEWVQSAAALALARTQDATALSALGRALRKPGRVAELAEAALLAYPPRDISPILEVPGAATRELCHALGALGDVRAESFLRDVVRRGAPDVRAAAALALLRFERSELVELARHWLRSERQPVLVAAATEILVQRGAPDGAAALSELAASDSTRELAITLLLAARGPISVPATLEPEQAGARAPELLEMLARSADAPSAERLERALARPDFAGLAVYALSRAPGAKARQRLERALTEPKLRVFALRALALRSARLREDSSVLRDVLPAALASKQGPERAAAAFARAVIDPDALPALLRDRDPLVTRSVARLATSGAAARAAVERLGRERDPILRVALSVGLLDPDAAGRAPTPLLLELTHEGGPGALLAAFALAARKDADLLPLLRELLTSGDPWLRAHALLGLSLARDPDVLGLIEHAYRFEPDAAVRHAAVVAVSRRPEPVRTRLLRLAAELDDSAFVRDAARRALAGHALGGGLLGNETAWLELAKNPGLADDVVPAALFRTASGLALPAVADPDGVVVLANVDPAPLDVRLALLGQRVNVPGPVP